MDCVNSLYGSQDTEGYDQCGKRHCVAHLGDGLQHGDVLLKKKKKLVIWINQQVSGLPSRLNWYYT